MDIKKLLPKIQENVSLAEYTTFKIGGQARYFYVTKTEKDLVRAIKAAIKCKLPFFILGGGSNVLIADEGYKGLIINFQFSIFNFPRSRASSLRGRQKNKVVAGAGVKLTDLVKLSLEKGLTGLEWAAGIPGTVGGAVRGNAGAFGSCLADIVKSVKVLEIQDKTQNSNRKSQNYSLKPKALKNKNCQFGYRDSIFKHNQNLIILSCEFKLKKGNKKEIENKIKENLKIRSKTQPLNFPSAGSIFKNPKKNSAAYLIEKCGLKGKRIGGAEISKKHANFILNVENAKANDVKKLIDLIKKKVKNKFGITLKEEICYLGILK